MKQRILITGAGLVTSLVTRFDQLPDAIHSGACGIREVFSGTRLRSRLGARLPEDEIEGLAEREMLNGEMDRTLLLSLSAARQAIQQGKESESLLVSIGVGAGEMARYRQGYQALQEGRRDKALAVLRAPSALGGALASRLGYRKGQLLLQQTACAAGLTAIGEAADRLRAGRAEVALAGGVLGLDVLLQMGFDGIRALSKDACRPFDQARSGTVLGDGSAFFMLETEERALQRKARVLGEFGGYGMSNDAFHRTRPDPSGAGQAKAILRALDDAGVEPQQVDLVYAHGTATPANDGPELNALQTVLGERGAAVPVVSVKGAIGHTIAASGPVNLAYALTAMNDGLVAGNVGLREPIDEFSSWTLPKAAMSYEPTCVLINAFAFGGNNTSAVVRRWPG